MIVANPILIIDDEPFLRMSLGLVLTRVGYKVEEAASAADGLYMASTHHYDLIFLDLQLPDQDGLEILPRLRLLQPRTPVLILTANGSLDKASQALRMGAYEFLLKPVGPGEIISQVDDILRQRRDEAETPADERLPRAIRDLTAEDCLPVLEDEEGQLIYAGSLLLDLAHQLVQVGEKVIQLPPCTFEYLVTLARHAPKAVNYRTLVGESQGYWLTPLEAQDLARWRIYRLRNVLEEDPGEPRYIISEPGTGYRLMVR